MNELISFFLLIKIKQKIKKMLFGNSYNIIEFNFEITL